MDFQQMEKNLATMIRQIDCSLVSEPDRQPSDDPVDPFHKKIFQRRLRRSSVASDCAEEDQHSQAQTNPDKLRFSQYCRPVMEEQKDLQNYQAEEAENQVEKIFDEGMNSLLQAKVCALEQVRAFSRQGRGLGSIFHSQKSEKIERQKTQYLENLHGKMNFICQYLTKKHGEQSQQGKNQVKFMETYECDTEGSIVGKQSNQECSSLNYWSEENNSNLANITTKKTSKEKKIKDSRNQGGSRVGAPKSVYESVLEERKQRNKKKRSRIV